MKNLIFIVFAAFFSISAHAQNAPEDLLNTFFKEYEKDPGKAVDNIYATNPWSSRIKDGIEALKKEVNSYTIDYMGKYYGHELITRKQFSESFVLISYMVKYDRQPLRFTFKIYKPDTKWTLYSFNIDSELDDEINQAAKLYYLNLGEDKWFS